MENATTKNKEKILITGIAGDQAGLIAEHLAQQYEVYGVDLKGWQGKIPAGIYPQVRDIRRKGCADLILKHKIKKVLHLTVNPSYEHSTKSRHALNIEGTRRLLDDCAEYGVEKVVLLSAHSVYGALPGNSSFLQENAPLNGSRVYPKMADVIQVDHMCSELFWKTPQIETVILRPVNILGPQTSGLLNSFLKQKKVITPMGFNPMMQIIHEKDVCHAVQIALQNGIKGIFNVTGPGEVPLSVLIEASGAKKQALPEPVAKQVIGAAFRLGRYPLPPSTLSFFQFVLSIDGTLFKNTTTFEPEFSLQETTQSVRN